MCLLMSEAGLEGLLRCKGLRISVSAVCRLKVC